MVKDLEKTLWATADKLRNNMDAAERVNIRLDYGVGRGSSSFYFSVTEAF